MKKAGLMCLLFIAAIILSIIPFAAADIQLKEKAVNNIVIKELNIPAKFDITIINNNPAGDYFLIDTLLDINITPHSKVFIEANGEKTVSIEILPSEDLKSKQAGDFTFEYYVKGDKSELKKSAMTLKFVPLSDLISIQMPTSVSISDSEIPVNVNLSEDVSLDSDLTLVSELLSYSMPLTLDKKGDSLSVPLNSEMPKAGTYEVKATFTINGYDYSVSKDIVLESVISTSESSSQAGYFLDRKITESEENTGNSVTDVTVSITKSVVAGLFTTFSMKPTNIKRQGDSVTYEFTKSINPGEKITVEARTCYYLPIAIIILLIAAGWIFIVVITPQVKIMKKAVKVRTRSGAFATKIVLSIKNKGKNEVTSLKVIDRLPAFTELVPEKFGTISPTEIRKNTLIWNIDRLAHNEEVLLSYIVYSKLTIIGKLDIPVTYATYMDSKVRLKEAKSNGLSVIAPENPPVQTEIIK